MKLYHLTDPKNRAAIEAVGLTANEDGEIFTFTDMLVANTIARDQVFLERYIVFQIDAKSFRRKIGRDDVAEFSASLHRIVKAPNIPAKLITFVGEFETIFREPTEWDFVIGEARGVSRHKTSETFRILNSGDSDNEKNRQLKALFKQAD